MSLNGWQRVVLVGVAGLIVVVQVNQINYDGVEGTGWVFALLAAAGLVVVALASRRNGLATTAAPVAAAPAPRTEGSRSPPRATRASGRFDPLDPMDFLGVCSTMANTLEQRLLSGDGEIALLARACPIPTTGKEMIPVAEHLSILRANVERASLGYCFGLLTLIGYTTNGDFRVTAEFLAAEYEFGERLEKTCRRCLTKAELAREPDRPAEMASDDGVELSLRMDECLQTAEATGHPFLPLQRWLAEESGLWDDRPQDDESLLKDLGKVTSEVVQFGSLLMGLPPVGRKSA